MSYLLTFFRFVIGFVFVIAWVGKVRDIPAFVQAIDQFRFFPPRFSKPLAVLYLLGEFGTIVAMLIGGGFLKWGFLLATLMFLSFSIALTSVILRKIKTSCNCFGPDQKDIGFGHVLRSLGFMLCGVGGGLMLSFHHGPLEPVGVLYQVFIGIFSVAFVIVWMNIEDILQLLVPQQS
jgi:hypothetical protein